MIETALQVTAEQTITWSADGVLLQRAGNRSPHAAPQGLSACAGEQQWLAISVASDDQWRQLTRLVDDGRMLDADLTTAAGRHAQHDLIDDVLSSWATAADRDDAVARLLAAGVPAAPVWNQSFIDELPQLAARGYWQRVTHAVMGEVQLPSTGMWSASIDLGFASSAPLLGADTDAVLLAAGICAEELEDLKAAGIVG